MRPLKMPQDRLHRLKVAICTARALFKALGAACQPVLSGLRTANSGEHQLSAFVTPNAPDISAVPDDGWCVIAPYGTHPSPDRTYTQVFTREQADKVVKTWNSLTGAAARWFKNIAHGLGGKFSAPVWDGHPETDKGRWPKEHLLGEITALRAGDAGLEGRQTWNSQGCERRTRGPLYPSPLWWHFPKDAQGRVFPELLESVGLVPTPNISAVPAWTENASPDPASAEVLSQTANTTEDTMKTIAEKLGLPENATEVQIAAKVAELLGTANAAAENIRTANSTRDAVQGQLTTANALVTTLQGEKTTLTGQLTTANATITTLQGEKTTLATANAELTGIVTELAAGVAHGFELAGVVPPSDRETITAKLTANATAKDTVAELKGKKAVMNVKSITLGADKKDISTANSRRQVIDDAVKKRMTDQKESYDVAYAAVQADPKLKGVFEAMADPTKSTAA